LKFQAVAEKTAKDARGLLYFAAPGSAGNALLHETCSHNVVVDVVLGFSQEKRC